MSTKTLVTFGLILGSIVGGYIPVLFGAGMLSYASIFGSGIGALLGIYLGYKLSTF